PVANFASRASPMFLMAGILLYSMHVIAGSTFSYFMMLGIGLFAVGTLFQAVTLPVEFDASRRAKEQLSRLGIVSANEAPAVQQVLRASGMTYVAGLVTAFMQLLYWVSVAQRRR